MGKKLIHVFLYFIFRGIKCNIDRQTGLRGPNPCSSCSTFYSLAPFFLPILPVVLIITKTSYQMALRKSIRDVQSLGSRHKMGILHYWIFYTRVTVHATLRNWQTALRIRHAAPSNTGSMLFWVTNRFRLIISMLLWVITVFILNSPEVCPSALLAFNI